MFMSYQIAIQQVNIPQRSIWFVQALDPQIRVHVGPFQWNVEIEI